jgi:hypothetical protein
LAVDCRRRVGGVQLERPQAESLAAEPRTNELDTDERRRIIGGEEALGCGWGVGPWRWSSEWVSHAPIRRPYPRRGGHDRGIRGPGLLSQVIERGWAAAHA